MSDMNLAGIHAKIRRAEQQIQMISDEADEICKDVQQCIVREVHQDLDEQTWVYRGPTLSAPIEWSVIIGEILYNLRSALDHLVWQLVLANDQIPGRHNEFPITKDHEQWQRERSNLLKGVGQRHQAMIGYLQPFTGGINLPFDVSKLNALNDLSNIEKHRHLIVTVLASSVSDVNIPALEKPRTGPPLKGTTFNRQLKTGKVLAKFNNVNTEVIPSFLVDIRFAGEAQLWTTAASVPEVLAKYLDTVKGSVEFLTTSMGNAFVEASGRS